MGADEEDDGGMRVGDEEDDERAGMAPASIWGKSTAWSLNRPRPVGSLRAVAAVYARPPPIPMVLL